MNDFIKYYTEHSILPVSQNLSDFSLHHAKREKLYRQLGITPAAFKGAKVLEVGPGRGHNTLSFFEWGCAHVTLVEPNIIGVEEMQRLFAEQKIDKSRYDIEKCTIENFKTDEKYDIIIAEGFLHSIANAKEIISQISDFVNEGGVVVITCMDYAGMFVEQMKRLVAWSLVRDVEDYEKRVEICTEFFTPQFDHVTGMSRSVKDWVRDDILNPAFNADSILNIIDGIENFSDDFSFLGSSQRIFTDYSWYKDLDYDERKNMKHQYYNKRHNFLMTGLDETLLNDNDSDKLQHGIEEIRSLEKEYENSYSEMIIKEIGNKLEQIEEIMDKIDRKCGDFVRECIQLIKQQGTEFDCSGYTAFSNAMGRTQQYLSMVKRVKYGKNC